MASSVDESLNFLFLENRIMYIIKKWQICFKFTFSLNQGPKLSTFLVSDVPLNASLNNCFFFFVLTFGSQ